jgi:riboflavin kinase/FMN adenylyltransferase
LCVGVFDGVHKGHQLILKKTIALAKVRKLPSAVLTFTPHPVNILNPKHPIKMLSTLSQRLKYFDGLGLDFCSIINFSRRFAAFTPERFIKAVLKNLQPAAIIVGSDFRFGKDLQGDAAHLLRLSGLYGFSVRLIRAYRKDGFVVSSSLIRNLLFRGRIREANKFLGRPYAIAGVVTAGIRLGTSMGFPTINLRCDNSILLPLGIFRGFAKVCGRRFRAAIYIGFKPTLKTHLPRPSVEAHLLNFQGNIYGQSIELSLLSKIRSDKRFNSIERLRQAITADIETVEKVSFNADKRKSLPRRQAGNAELRR